MKLDINIGDILLTGRYKNKHVKVKSLGTDELGQPIFNKDRKLLSVRIEKKLPEKMWSAKTLAAKYKDSDMDKKALLEEAYNSAFDDELEKIAQHQEPSTDVGVNSVIGALSPQVATTIPAFVKALQRASSGKMRTDQKKIRNVQTDRLQKAMGTKQNIFLRTPESVRGGGGSFTPKGIGFDEKYGVHLWAKNKKLTPFEMGILSHELGHSKNIKGWVKKPYMFIRRFSPASSLFGAVGTAFAKDKDKARNIAMASSVIPTGVLAEEGLATVRGWRGLAKTHGGGAGGWRKALLSGKAGGLRASLLTAGSYGAAAAAPLIAYGIRNRLSNR